MALSLSSKDSHGWQSLELPSHETSPFIESPIHEVHNLRQAPMQRDTRQLSTPSEPMEHPTLGETAPGGTIRNEKRHNSRVVTRLTNPMQLHRKLSGLRKRGQTPNPSLPSPRDAEKSELDGSAAETPQVEASNNGLWAFEKNAGGFPELDGKQPFQMNGYEDSEFTSELPGQSVDSGLNGLVQLFAVDAVGELNTPYSAFVPSPWSSSATSQQTTSGTWSAISQSSTSFGQSLRASPRYSESIEYRSQQPIINQGSWVSPGPGTLLGPVFSPDGNTSLGEMSSASSPKELISSPGSHGPWYSGYSLNSQQGILQSTHANAVQYSHNAENYVHQIEGSDQIPSWQNPAFLSLQYFPMPTAASSEFTLPMSSAPISEHSQLVDQPTSNTNFMVPELDYSIIIEQSPAVNAASSLSARKSHPSSNLPQTRKSMGKPPPRAKRAKSGQRKSRIDAATDMKDDNFRCTFPNCKHQPTGVYKNRRGHLERHMRTHMPERLLCPFPGCKTDFPVDRKDNLTAHCLRIHRTRWQAEIYHA